MRFYKRNTIRQKNVYFVIFDLSLIVVYLYAYNETQCQSLTNFFLCLFTYILYKQYILFSCPSCLLLLIYNKIKYFIVSASVNNSNYILMRDKCNFVRRSYILVTSSL